MNEEPSDEAPADVVSVQEPHFRDARWGMSLEEVKATEGAKPTSEAWNRIQYTDRVLDENAQLTYAFTDKRQIPR